MGAGGRWQAGHVPVDLRPATPDDVVTLADLFRRSREANRETIPPIVHPPETVEPFLRHVVATDEVWVAVLDGGGVVGFVALDADGVDHLYVDPGNTGDGVGSLLVERAKERRPHGLSLWTFVSNTGARRFWARHGFVVVGGTDGDNEEGAPDLRLAWTPSPSP